MVKPAKKNPPPFCTHETEVRREKGRFRWLKPKSMIDITEKITNFKGKGTPVAKLIRMSGVQKCKRQKLSKIGLADSVALTRLGREIFLEFSLFAVMFLGIVG